MLPRRFKHRAEKVGLDSSLHVPIVNFAFYLVSRHGILKLMSSFLIQITETISYHTFHLHSDNCTSPPRPIIISAFVKRNTMIIWEG